VQTNYPMRQESEQKGKAEETSNVGNREKIEARRRRVAFARKGEYMVGL
jgi:hypothetical protein